MVVSSEWPELTSAARPNSMAMFSTAYSVKSSCLASRRCVQGATTIIKGSASQGVAMTIRLEPASAVDLPLARGLARRGMLPYYITYELIWQDQAFDETWLWREQWVVRRDGDWLGFLSLSADRRALYIRELHLVEAARGQGVGAQVLDQVLDMAQTRRLPLVRLTVFKSNRAQRLYRRQGFVQVGEDEFFLRMERRVPD